MSNGSHLNWIASKISGLAELAARCLVHRKYRDSPMTILRHLDTALDSTKWTVPQIKAARDTTGRYQPSLRPPKSYRRACDNPSESRR